MRRQQDTTITEISERISVLDARIKGQTQELDTARNLVEAEVESVKRIFNSQLQTHIQDCKDRFKHETDKRVVELANTVRMQQEKIRRLRAITSEFELRKMV